jgi:hypothetical protein
MFEIIGMIVVWSVGQILFLAGPIILGMNLSDRRRDDGRAAYMSIGWGIFAGCAYFFSSLVIFVTN